MALAFNLSAQETDGRFEFKASLNFQARQGCISRVCCKTNKQKGMCEKLDVVAPRFSRGRNKKITSLEASLDYIPRSLSWKKGRKEDRKEERREGRKKERTEGQKERKGKKEGEKGSKRKKKGRKKERKNERKRSDGSPNAQLY